MTGYNIVASTSESTVVAEYVPDSTRSDTYQSEAELEREFIQQLVSQGYEYLVIHSEAALVANLRHQLELLNAYTFSDAEWQRFFGECIDGANEGIVEKTRKIQDDHVQILKRDDGTTKNIYLIDKANIHNNRLQVINQYEVAGGAHALIGALGVHLGQLLTVDYNWSEINVFSQTRFEKCTFKCNDYNRNFDANITPEDIDINDTATFVWEIQ